MSDIVERLRAENADPREWRRMYGEAADEIERLRAAVRLDAKQARSDAAYLRYIAKQMVPHWPHDAAEIKEIAARLWPEERQ